MKATNDVCSNTGIIDNLDECISAVGYLKKRGVHVVYDWFETEAEYPKGCYKYTSKPEAYWNNHISGNAHLNAQPICKEGE